MPTQAAMFNRIPAGFDCHRSQIHRPSEAQTGDHGESEWHAPEEAQACPQGYHPLAEGRGLQSIHALAGFLPAPCATEVLALPEKQTAEAATRAATTANAPPAAI